MTADRTGCPGRDDDTAARRSRRRRRVVGALAGLTLALGGAPATADAAGALNGRIGFTTFRFNGTGDIANMNPDGSDLRRLTTDPPGTPLYDAQSDWSPDGQRIAYRHENPTTRRFEVWTMDLYGNEQLGLGRGTQPSWAPDGQSMLFRDSSPHTQATDIFAMDTDGRNRRLAVTLPKDQLYPAYSPDMSRIVFASLHAGTSRKDRGIYTTDADGSNLTRLFDRAGSYDSAPNWSPDGDRVAFESNLDGDMEIYVMDADGSNVEKLTDNLIHDEGPSWSPDGRRMAFTRGTSEFEDPDVWVMNVDGTAERRLTDAPNRDESPDWQPIPHSGDYASCGDAVEEGAGPWSVKAAGKGLSCDKARAVSSRWGESASSGKAGDSIRGFVCESSDAGYRALKVECTHHGNRPGERGNDKSILFVWRGDGGERARLASMEAGGEERAREGARGRARGSAAGR